jgi:putative transposase
MNQKKEFVLRAMNENENFQALCREYGISTKTGYKWKGRFLERGLMGLEEESRRPHKSPEELGEKVVCEIVRLKERHRHWGPKKIREIYRREHDEVPSESSFKRVLERAGMVEKRVVRKAREGGRMSSGRRGTEPNEVWAVDFKGYWRDAEGERCEPLTVSDEYSRYVMASRRMESAKTERVWEEFEVLFERHGLPVAIRSDNGGPFASTRSVLGLSRLSVRWVALGIDLERGRPGKPGDNGRHERIHLDIWKELEREKKGSQAELEVWRQEHNEVRPHESLGMKCPAEVYRNSERKYKGLPKELDYEGMERRKIMKYGRLVWRGKTVFISSALAGWHVGLKSMGAERWEVYFANLRVGVLELPTESFIAAPWRRDEASASSEEKALP